MIKLQQHLVIVRRKLTSMEIGYEILRKDGRRRSYGRLPFYILLIVSVFETVLLVHAVQETGIAKIVFGAINATMAPVGNGTGMARPACET